MRHEGAPVRYSSLMKLPLCVRPFRGRAAPRWTQLSDRF
jgi:hypothetical protein